MKYVLCAKVKVYTRFIQLVAPELLSFFDLIYTLHKLQVSEVFSQERLLGLK